MEKEAKIYVTGHTGLLGSAITKELRGQGYNNLILRTRKELDLRDQTSVSEFFKREKPDYVFSAAAKVGGVKANTEWPAEFIYDNIQIQSNILESAKNSGVKKLLFLASNCIYPKDAPQPLKEESLMCGKIEETNEPYAIAKISGIKMCQAYNKQYGTNFICAIPASLFGPNDNFDLESSHLVPAFIRKFIEAKERNQKEIKLWGTGESRREIMYADDAAKACIFLMEKYSSSEIINVGFGSDFKIKEIAYLVAKIAGFNGEILFDMNKRSGITQKLLDSSKANSLGWKPKIGIEEGIKKTIEWYLENK